MRKRKIIGKSGVLIFCMASFLMTRVKGQGDGKEPFMKAMREMIGHYRDTRYLSFDVTYRYASEQDPGKYLDSLTGSYKLDGSNYWYSLDNTEVIGSRDYSVMLFKEDHIMYLAPPATRGRMDFLASLDSFLLTGSDVVPTLKEESSQRTLLLSFGKRSPCKSIEYSIDKRSGYITRIRQVVKAEQLYDPSVRSALDTDSLYAVIDMEFSGYRSGSFDARQLDIGSYFKKEGQEYVTVPPYDSYKIFLGAPNL